jgi:hypothetical protein
VSVGEIVRPTVKAGPGSQFLPLDIIRVLGLVASPVRVRLDAVAAAIGIAIAAPVGSHVVNLAVVVIVPSAVAPLFVGLLLVHRRVTVCYILSLSLSLSGDCKLEVWIPIRGVQQSVL